jgi:mRNA interferase MazF
MLPGEIYLANFPFGDTPQMKLRPVYLLTGPIGSIPEILVAYISSVVPTRPLASDLLMDPGTVDFQSSNLKALLRLHKLATIHATSIVRRLGHLDAPIRVIISDKLRAMLGVSAT